MHVQLECPFAFPTGDAPLPASIGMATCPTDADHGDRLLTHADAEMYAVKRARAAGAASPSRTD
jgi:predicted signal transduction protein with EAL and GGDEF domain